MTPTSDSLIHCAEVECSAVIKNDRWSKLKSDWFFSKDGLRYCPSHTPAWVQGWRDSKKKKESGQP